MSNLADTFMVIVCVAQTFNKTKVLVCITLDHHIFRCFQLRQVKKKIAEKLMKQMQSSKAKNYIVCSTELSSSVSSNHLIPVSVYVHILVYHNGKLNVNKNNLAFPKGKV